MPETNKDYWKSKIEGNKKRDKKVNQELKHNRWKVLRIWEHEIKSKRTIDKIKHWLIMS